MATIKDVAARAGVAPSTVSYVLSGSRRISDETRLVVQQAIAELDYHPSASARTLRSSRTQVLALALPRAGGSYRAVDGRFAIEICDAARAHGYDVLMLTEREGVPGLRRIAGGGQADGAILMAVTVDDPRVAAVRTIGLPVALLGTGRDAPGEDDASAPFADLDWAAAAELALTRAATAGHRRIAFLACSEQELADRKGYAVRGLAGADAAAARLGAASSAQVQVLASTSDEAELQDRLRALLTGPDRVTALAVQHVAALPAVLAALETAGLRAPEDVSVIPVGCLPGELGGRRLPRIELPVSEMAAAVTQLVVAGIAAGTVGADPYAVGCRVIAPKLLDAELLSPRA